MHFFKKKLKNHPVVAIKEISVQKKGEPTMIDILKKLISDEEGQDLVEYALLLVFIALAAIAVLPTLGSAVNNVFSRSASTLSSS